MSANNSILKKKLDQYKRKYYLNQLVKGIILFLAIILSTYLISTSVDFGFKPGTTGRSLIFFSFVGIMLITMSWMIVRPLLHIYAINKQISDEEAARQIGILFPELKDKLLNTIQLTGIESKENSLIAASIQKRIEEISIFQFSSRIKLSANKKYIKYVAYPAIPLLILFLFVPQFLTESTVRIVKFDEDFKPSSYFTLVPMANNDLAFKNEDYTVQFQLQGNIVPDKIYLRSHKRRIKVSNVDGIVSYTFKKVQDDFDYSFEAADYSTESYHVDVYSRPDIKTFNVQLQYPNYTGIENETLQNSGNLNVPEGTNINWLVNTIASDSVFFSFAPEYKKSKSEKLENQIFKYSSKVFEDQKYNISLNNEFSANKDEINYNIEVIKDKFPSLSINMHRDTTLFSYVAVGGNVSDDYGISRLELVYQIKNNGVVSKPEVNNISINRNQKTQNYFYQWMLDSLELNEGDQLEYFLRVWDNDGINGAKFTKSSVYNFNLPTKKEIKEDLAKQAEGAKEKLDSTLEEAKELKKEIDDIQDKLKSKKKLDWQDKKQIEELIKQKEKLESQMKELKKQNEAFNQKKERFSKQSEQLKEKVQQLQKLMEDLLDEETKKLYDELKKLLEEQKSIDQVQNMMDQIENKETNMEKEIERTIELFKKMQFEQKMEDVINELDEFEKEQNDLSEKTKDKSNDTEQLKEDQEELNEKFEEIEEEMDELEKMNEELKNPENMEDSDQDAQDIKEEQEKASEQLDKKQRKKASQSQKNAGEKAKGLKKKMESMQSSMQMESMQENMDNLRDIIDNLVKVSFDQEKIMQEFRGVNQSDPRYVSLSQRQLKLRDDSRIIEDSLQSLASRVFQIASFVTRELDAMNDNIEASLQGLKDRKVSIALKNQQLAMTSINNLALLLDDILKQMQQQMSDAMGNPNGKGKGKKQQMPGLSELQQQLNKQIEDLKKSGKSGRQLSEELAKMAAKQEMIRQQLKEMEGKMDGGEKPGGKAGNNGMQEAIKKMEQTEMDLVNKRITQQTIQRQKDILTRLLKAENAMRERELDKEREAQQGDDLNRTLPPQFEEYLKAKEKEVELLKTIPLKLNPYYKEEVNKYFKRLSEQ